MFKTSERSQPSRINTENKANASDNTQLRRVALTGVVDVFRIANRIFAILVDQRVQRHVVDVVDLLVFL